MLRIDPHSQTAAPSTKGLLASFRSCLTLLGMLVSVWSCSAENPTGRRVPSGGFGGAMAGASAATMGGSLAGGGTAGSFAGGGTGGAMAGAGAGGGLAGGVSSGMGGVAAGGSGGASVSGMAGGAMAGGGMAGGGMAGGGMGGMGPAPTFATLKEVLMSNLGCLGSCCHGGVEANVDLRVTDQLHETLTTHTSMRCENLPLVDPGNPEGSALVRVLKAPCGTLERMPAGCIENEFENSCVPDDYIAAIEQWVADGAPEE